MNKGFGLIGLLVAILIIGLLAVWMLPQYTHHVQTQHNNQVQAVNQVRQVEQQLKKQQQQQARQLERLGY
ncbi:MAG: prepilin-type N-terminal cleavage/methylation domain-containing protein [Elusimicrobiaceae bacterium]|nr:prepilin-type N-terminal cleavage/methylation domain-containing protein [Elusimicrobiaceae bacterium]